ncbi:MAG: TolB family protein, partial [Acidobacteriaceae bacterium]
ILAAIGLTVAAWVMRPRLLEVYPHPGEQNVSAVAPIRLIFSRNMQASSVLERLSIEPSVRGGFSWDDHTLTFSPTDSWPGGQEIKLSLATGARAKSWLAFPLGSQSWSFFTSQSSLAYLWPAEGPAEIYILNPETGDVHQMTSGMAVMEYTVSSDGFMVYFSASNSEGGSDLYVYERLKAAITESIYRPRLLLDCGLAQCRSPAVSFGGTSLAYEYLPSTNSGGLAPASIWLLDLETLSSSQIGQAGHETVQPAWSSKGLLAYYDRSNSCYELYDIQNQARLQVPNQTGQPGTWSPDGEFYLAPEIYYTSSAGQGETGTSHLLKYAAQTGVSEDLSQLVDVEDVEGIFAPDGRSIAFERKFLDSNQWTLGRQIWLMTPDGSGAHPITDAPDYNHYDLAWSLDSLKIAYVRFNQAKLSTPPELWIVDADGSNRIELVVGGYAPQWTP